MITFARLYEEIQKRKGILMNTGEQKRALSIIRLGKNLHKKNQTPFWEEFISLCNDSEGLSELLGVSREVIQSWPSKISDALDESESSAESPYDKMDQKVIPTGENGAFVTNQDPYIS